MDNKKITYQDNELTQILHKDHPEYNNHNLEDIIRQYNLFLNNIVKENNKDTFYTFEYYNIKNITENAIYKLIYTFNEKETKTYIFKVRKEGSPMTFSEEEKYINLLKQKHLIPDQFLYAKLDNNILSIEEYINVQHTNESDLFTSRNLDLLVTSITEVNGIAHMHWNKNNYYLHDTFFFTYLINKTIQQAYNQFNSVVEFIKNNQDKEVKEYYTEIKEVISDLKTFFFDKDLIQMTKSMFVKKNSNILLFSLIDIHNENLFIVKDSVKFIDFEDISFNFAGFDLANLLIDSIYSFIDCEKVYPFFEYGNVNGHVMEEGFLIEQFKRYIDMMNEKLAKSEIQLEYYDIEDIYRLVGLSIIKANLEYCFMLDNSMYKKTDIDFFLLMNEKVKTFNRLFNIQYK